MPFEVFNRQRPPLHREPYVTIQRRGTMSLNAAAHEALGSPEAVELLFDRQERLMGMRKISPKAEHAYAVRPSGKKASSFLVAGMAFSQYYDIPRDVARRWPAELRDGVLIVDLKSPATEVTSNRSRKGAQRSSGS